MRRRKFLSLAGLLTLPMPVFATSRSPTPADAEGPFYPVIPIPLRRDLINDEQALVGDAIQLAGRVLDQQGQALKGAKVEIWQCDGNGFYQHPRQTNHQQFDKSFAGFGAQLTNEQGHYHFTTLYPAPYPGRPPHIHVKIWYKNQQMLTTQLYLEGKTGGGWFNSQLEPLQINPKRDANGILQAQFTFVI